MVGIVTGAVAGVGVLLLFGGVAAGHVLTAGLGALLMLTGLALRWRPAH